MELNLLFKIAKIFKVYSNKMEHFIREKKYGTYYIYYNLTFLYTHIYVGTIHIIYVFHVYMSLTIYSCLNAIISN